MVLAPLQNSKAPINDAIATNMRSLLDAIDELRVTGVEQDIPIPQIAVMGDQSSGKSSVLEALSGVHFPRGTGLVTKCAVEVRMKRLQPNEDWNASVSLSWDRPQPSEAGVATTPNEVGEKISKLTEVLLRARGNRATFEPEHRIQVELKSPDVSDLTIIDLPGIVRTNVAGQCKKVIAEVDALLDKYLRQERTIILAVIPSTVDIATVDVIERAEKVDPHGLRTIGVLTKADQISSDDEAERVAVLRGVRKPLKLGYFMVKNRTQTELEAGVTLAEARLAEARYFSAHKTFGKLHPGLFGSQNLAERLSDVLATRIRDDLPLLVKQIEQQCEDTCGDLEDMGAGPPTSHHEARHRFCALSRDLHKLISSATSGTYSHEAFSRDQSLRLISLVRDGPQREFETALLSLKPTWSTEQLQNEIRHMRGRELPGFPRFETFEMLTQSFVRDWKEPCNKLLSDMACVLSRVCLALASLCVTSDGALVSELAWVIQARIAARVARAKEEGVDKVLQNEMQAYTSNPAFVENYNRIQLEKFEKTLQDFPEQAVPQSKFPGSLPLVCAAFTAGGVLGKVGDQPKEFWLAGAALSGPLVMLAQWALLDAYWETAVRRFADNVSMVLDRELIQDLADDIQSHLEQHLVERDLMAFFNEDARTVERRLQLESKRDRLVRAREALQRINLAKVRN
eukprot:gene12591-14880_t